MSALINSDKTEQGKPGLGSGCTQAIVTGLTALSGNMNGQCVDSPAGWWQGYIQLVVPKSGNRYLMAGDTDTFALMNEKGVALSGGLRPVMQFAPYPGKPKYRTKGEMLRTADSAAEYMKMWAEDFTKYGCKQGSNCTLVTDIKEGYCMEGANFVYGDPSNHVIHGPMTDQVFVSANFFISRRLKTMAESGIGCGYTRAKRLWELLIDRQYDSITMQPARQPLSDSILPPLSNGSGITMAYFMKCLRDHGNIDPREGSLSCYIPEERGQGALCAHGIRDYTTNAFFGVSKSDHTDLISCEWITPNQPCISPFLPIYIGVNEVPKALATTEAFDLFEKLRAEMDFHPEYRDDVTKYWASFEIRAIEESSLLDVKAAKFADSGDVKGARSLLTEFVAGKSNEAVAAGRKMLDFLCGLPILKNK
jgi:hypothetical protein